MLYVDVDSDSERILTDPEEKTGFLSSQFTLQLRVCLRG